MGTGYQWNCDEGELTGVNHDGDPVSLDGGESLSLIRCVSEHLADGFLFCHCLPVGKSFHFIPQMNIFFLPFSLRIVVTLFNA